MNDLWARVSGTEVEITKGKGPLAEVVEVIPCGTRERAQATLNKVLKEMGRTYGGQS